MSDVADRVRKIVVEHLGVEEDKVTENASFIDDLGADSLDTVELVMARQHLWAEALDKQLQRQLRHTVPMQAPAYVAQLQASADSVRLSVQLDRFHGLSDGYAVISGQFNLTHQTQSHRFDIRVALKDDGYPALVLALGQGVEQLSQQIAQQLKH